VLSHQRFAGVLGWPLQRTLSPALHAAAFAELGLDWVYLEWPVPPQDLGPAVAGLRALGAVGANVTMPHKEAVIEHLDRLGTEAEAVRAVNTIEVSGDCLIGHNTDVSGFAAFVAGDLGIEVADRKCLVLGSGGAARAVVAALNRLGGREITVAGRRAEARAEVARLSPFGRSLEWTRASGLVARADIVVNTTPVGMQGEDLLPEARFTPSQVVIDLVYHPATTNFLARARRAGADAWGGLGMLVRQAAESLRLWTGLDPPVEVMSEAAVRALKRSG
jgi:shikimate dehydrogenase